MHGLAELLSSRREDVLRRFARESLAIARQLTLAHGGTLEVRSTPGEGTTFTVRLPREAPGA